MEARRRSEQDGGEEGGKGGGGDEEEMKRRRRDEMRENFFWSGSMAHARVAQFPEGIEKQNDEYF